MLGNDDKVVLDHIVRRFEERHWVVLRVCLESLGSTRVVGIGWAARMATKAIGIVARVVGMAANAGEEACVARVLGEMRGCWSIF
ncbi:hypothetical protein ACLB2K_062987 [Fragaria x ananassa]